MPTKCVKMETLAGEISAERMSENPERRRNFM